MRRTRRTRIMATVPDVRCNADFIRALHAAGMDSVRINSAHVDPETFKVMVRVIREAAPGVEILMDTKGPEIRTTYLPCPFTMQKGGEIDLREGMAECSAETLYVPVEGLVACLRPGCKVLFDDGEVTFEVMATDEEKARLKALDSGMVGSRKTIAFPDVSLPALPSVSERDKVMIEAARECGIEMIAHSFVRTAADVCRVRELINGTGIRLYAKIECREAVENMEEIAAAADGILVARGDLGTQVPLPTIPTIQLQCASTARQLNRSTMLATQILQSMLTRPTPLRAELSDIFLAVAEGFDCLLLTGETAQGDYPEACVRILHETISEAEKSGCRI